MQRTAESPMDWEWQTNGPSDPTSPYAQFNKNQVHRRTFESPSKLVLDSKSPQSPFFRPPPSPTRGGTSAAAAASPFRNPAFTTPRKPLEQDIFSETSGAESSPAEPPTDGDETPEQRTSRRMAVVSHSGAANRPEGEKKKQPIFGRYGVGYLGKSSNNGSVSPGRGEIRRVARYVDGVAQKARKRKRVERDVARLTGAAGGGGGGRRRVNSDSSDSESDGSRARRGGGDGSSSKSSSSRGRKGENPPPPPGWFAALLNGIESRPTLPHILSFYPQVALNYVLAGLVVWLIYGVISTIKADIDVKSEDEVAAVILEMTLCKNSFVENRCGSDRRAPALDQMCENWAACMSRDPRQVGRARLSAHTFGEILTSFFEPVSYKAMFCMTLLFAIAISIPNIGFRLLSSKTAHPLQQQQQQQQQQSAPQWYAPPLPPTPLTGLSQDYSSSQWPPAPETPRQSARLEGGFVGGDAHTPHRSIMPSQTPVQRSPWKGGRY